MEFNTLTVRRVCLVIVILACQLYFVVPEAEKHSFILNAGVVPARGVMPPWLEIVNTSLQHQNMSVPIALLDLTISDHRSQYDKMLKAMSKLKKANIHVVIGPYDDAIAMVTENLGIPYLSTSAVTKNKLNNTFQILPRLSDFGQSILDIVNYYKWDKVSLFYDDDKGVSIIEKLLTNHDLVVKSWRVDQLRGTMQIREHLVHMRRAFGQKSVLFCSKENTRNILEQARSLAMLSTPYEWFFYDPGDQLNDVFTDFPEVTVNFTMFGLMNESASSKIGVNEDRLNRSLAMDAISLIRSTVDGIRNYTTMDERKVLVDAIKEIRLTGLTGVMEFDESGRRSNFSIFLSEYNGFEKYAIGKWVSMPDFFDSRIQFRDRINRGNKTQPFPLRGRRAKVVMILEQPFTMHKRDYRLRHGNDRFEGFAVDLIKEVAEMLQFDYDIYLVHDGMFGSKIDDSNEEWNGMIGELLAGNATMSVAPISINSQREEAVDFTKPFMTRYISVLMKLPKSERSYFEFLNPLHHIVWFCTCGAFVVVSIILYMLEKIGASHNKDYPAISFRESLWFVFGSLLQGSTDASPSTLPGRILTSAWWFFALILISSYTANLAAFLTVKKINAPIKSVTDLASQTKIQYGTVRSSGIMHFFKQTTIEHFSKMWAQMSEVREQDSMVDTTAEGFQRVKQGNYAFFWDTTVNKYMTIMDCEFMEIGPHFDPKGFGIGVPPGATYREELSMAILRMSDTGLLHELENKWWGRRNCPDFTKPSADETSELQIENIAGVFFILVGGIVFAAIVCGFEHFTKMLHNAAKKQKTPQAEKERESFLLPTRT
ncbi:glutamate receptor 4-like [Mizuhopecten yessoensis]|uniref:Glutamate receptor 4 n=1 Tax=Mizuhopecten yessoensis TaxID=6573 RepID=A0A210QJN2_MIZYE|nr:glutamate receptor 4-like [Mizuhopecten yessoensis]OWF48940.1 Glutamate receptor 4 [Mizuhopecten yessoensis]